MNGIHETKKSESARSAKVRGGTRGSKLTQERVRELFDYADGVLIRKCGIGKKVKKGDIAGCEVSDGRGYLITRVDGKLYYNHRLVWLWNHGFLPENGIDHIDRNTGNNRIENLREVSKSCNARNSKQKGGCSGIKGVYYSNNRMKWRAQIIIMGKTFYLCSSLSILEAACHRLAAEQCCEWLDCESSPSFDFVKSCMPSIR